MKFKSIRLAILLVAVAALFAPTSFGQAETKTLEDFRFAIVKANDVVRAKQIKATIARSGLAAGLIECVNDFDDVMTASLNATKLIQAHYGGNAQNRSAAAFNDLQSILPLYEQAVLVPGLCLALLPPGDKDASVTDARNHLNNYVASLRAQTGELFATSARLRSLWVRTDKAKLRAEGKPVDESIFSPEYRAAVSELTKAIEYAPTRKNYEKRAEMHDALGEKAQAASDRTKAATMVDPAKQ